MKKQSSVEWLVNSLIKLGYLHSNGFGQSLKVTEVINQAKAMHKDEMEHFFKRGMFLVEGHLWKPTDKFEENYNETFGGNNENTNRQIN